MMRAVIIGAFVAVFLAFNVEHSAHAYELPLPKPSTVDLGHGRAELRKSVWDEAEIGVPIHVSSTPDANEARRIVELAVRRYSGAMFTNVIHCDGAGERTEEVIAAVSLQFDSSEVSLGVSTDSSYTIASESSGDGAHKLIVHSATCFGIVHALETVYQLLEDLNTKSVVGARVMPIPLSVEDSPRWKWRGLLVDTARHFYPVRTIEHILEVMSFAKLNVMHWHIMDDQSIPLDPSSLPELKKAAYSPEAIYTKSDIAHIIRYARERAIRIVPEFDFPGHTQAWEKAYPLAMARSNDCHSPLHNALLDFANEDAISLAHSLLNEYIPLFEDEYVHLGGDEVPSCFASLQPTAAQQKFLDDHHLNGMKDAITHLLKRNADVARGLGRKAIFWDEAFMDYMAFNNTATGVIGGSWRDWRSAPRSLYARGTKQVVSAGWYLDWDENHGDDTNTWHAHYGKNLWPFEELEPDNPLVVGGEASLWSEYISPGNFDSKAWPRAAAIGERLWSGISADIDKRILRWTCLAHARGAGYEPPAPGTYCPEVRACANVPRSDSATKHPEVERTSTTRWVLPLTVILFTCIGFVLAVLVVHLRSIATAYHSKGVGALTGAEGKKLAAVICALLALIGVAHVVITISEW